MVLFGGASDAGRYGDTWLYDPSANTWAVAGGAVLPLPRSAHAMVYDQSAGKVVLFGGVDDAGRFDDTWLYDSASDTWTLTDLKGSVPSPRSGHAMVFDPAIGASILFGGYDGIGLLDDTWVYDAQAGTWTELEPSGTLPSPRGNHRMVYDSDIGVVIMFGGSDGDKELADIWAYDPEANVWTELLPAGDAPSGREQHAMVYDPSAGRVLVFGGFDDTDTELNDLWDLTVNP
jgi:N-acetylneuraminic acid mutarotase